MFKYSRCLSRLVAFLGFGVFLSIAFGANSLKPVIAPVAPLIVERGQPISVTPVISGGTATALRWRFNGKYLSSQTGPALTLLKAEPTHGGTYELTASNHIGSSSVEVPVTVFERLEKSIPVTSGVPLLLPSRFWGPARVVWETDAGLSYFLHAGMNLPNLRLLVPAGAFRYYGLDRTTHHYTASLISGAINQEIASYELVNQLPLEILSVPEGVFNRARTIGQMFATGRMIEAAQYLVKGLPAGCTWDESTGFFELGEETPQGSYRVTWTVRTPVASVSKTSTIVIKNDELLRPLRGAYSGLFGFDGSRIEGAPRGVLQIQVGALGSVTGSLRSLNSSGRFAAHFKEDEGGAAIARLGAWFPGVRRTTLRILRNEAGEGFGQPMLAEMEFEMLTGEISTARSDMWRELSGDSIAERNLNTGLFVAHLRGEPGMYGHGFASMSIPASGRSILFTGNLPDGTGFTAGGLAYDLGDKTPGSPFYVYDPASTNLLYGAISSNPSGSGFTWEKRPRSPHLESFDRPFYFTVARQRPRLPGEHLFWLDTRTGDLNARIQAQVLTHELMNTPFTLRQNLTAVIPLPNAQKLKIDCYAPTGFFTGSFMTADPFSTSPALRRVQFRGMIIHSEGAGLGFFLYRAPATATAVPDPKPGLTVEVSGELSITPADL